MNKFDKRIREKAKAEKNSIPENVTLRIEETLNQLPEKKIKIGRAKIIRYTVSAAACVVFVMLFVLPNVSVTYAHSLENIPVINDIIRVVTIRNYFYSDDYHEMNVNKPEIEDNDNQQAADNINNDIAELTDKIVKEFYEEVNEIGSNGHGSVYVDYEVITNTDKWFTLKLSVISVRGSGMIYYKYYHINRETGENVYLGDLFNTPDYCKVIAEEIKEQMKERMNNDNSLEYWIDSKYFDYTEITDTHNYYFNQKGNLVIPFDKYEVAPGYMGEPQFEIDKRIIKKILKNEYKHLIK